MSLSREALLLATSQFKSEILHFREIEAYIHNSFSNKHEWVQGNLQAVIDSIESYKVDLAAQQGLQL